MLGTSEQGSTAVSDRPDYSSAPITSRCSEVLDSYTPKGAYGRQLKEDLSSRLPELSGFESQGRLPDNVARLFYFLPGLEFTFSEPANHVEAALLDEDPIRFRETPAYRWCHNQLARYEAEVKDGNPRGFDLAKAPDVLREGRERLDKIKAHECYGRRPAQEDVDFFAQFSDGVESAIAFLESMGMDVPDLVKG